MLLLGEGCGAVAACKEGCARRGGLIVSWVDGFDLLRDGGVLLGADGAAGAVKNERCMLVIFFGLVLGFWSGVGWLGRLSWWRHDLVLILGGRLLVGGSGSDGGRRELHGLGLF